MRNLKVFLLTAISILSLEEGFAQSPICIENWEGYCTFSEFLYDEPIGCGMQITKILSNTFALEGEHSRTITWDLKKGKYCGWGVDLTQGDPDNGFVATNVKYIYFKVKLGSGDEVFKINIKDTDNVQPGISSISFLRKSVEQQEVRIPIQKFGKKVNLTSLRDINFSFAKGAASKKGTITIDDFRFEYE